MTTTYKAFNKCIGCETTFVNGEITGAPENYHDGIGLNISCPKCGLILTTSGAYNEWEKQKFSVRQFISSSVRFVGNNEPWHRLTSDDIKKIIGIFKSVRVY
jgi:hypothetical protein